MRTGGAVAAAVAVGSSPRPSEAQTAHTSHTAHTSQTQTSQGISQGTSQGTSQTPTPQDVDAAAESAAESKLGAVRLAMGCEYVLRVEVNSKPIGGLPRRSVGACVAPQAAAPLCCPFAAL